MYVYFIPFSHRPRGTIFSTFFAQWAWIKSKVKGRRENGKVGLSRCEGNRVCSR